MRSAIVIGVSITALLVSACSPKAATPAGGTAPAAASQNAPVRGGILKVGQSSDATTLDPAYTTAAVDSTIYRSIYESLIEFDVNLQLAPKLATAWKSISDTEWEFTLRQGVKFHDGTLFNAAAVKANFDRILDPAAGSPRKGEIPYVKSVAVVDEYTVRFHLTAPMATLPYLLAGNPGIIISPAAITKYGRELATNPVGTGPFSFVSWQKGDHIDVKAFPEYWQKGKPYLDGVRYQGISDSQVKTNALQSGTVHAIDGLLAKDVAALKQSPNLQVFAKPGFSISALRFQLSKPPFNNKALREAVSWAIDKDAITKVLFFGNALAAHSFLPPTALGYEDKYNPFPARDLTKAKAKLAEGGQPNGFAFDATSGNDPQQLQVAQAIKQQLSDVGITMNIKVVDPTTVLTQLTKKEFVATFVNYSGSPDPFAGFTRFFLGSSTLNVYDYKNKSFDDLAVKAAATADPAARKQVYSQMNEILGNDAPWVFLYYPQITQALGTNVQGYTFYPDGSLRFTDTYLKK